MNKTPDPGEVVRDKVIPAAEELVASLAERVGPLAKEAVDQVSPVALAAAEKTVAWAHVAAEMVAPLTQQAADAVTPYAQQVGPRAQQAAQDLADRLEPALDAAKDALSGARDRVTTDYLPAVGAAAATAAASASPLVSAAADRGRSLVKGSRSEPVVVPPPKRKRGWLATVTVVAAAAGATYVLVRRLVGDKGSQWQSARPTTPYEPPVSAEAGVATPQPDPEHVAGGDTEVVASTTSLYGTVGSADAGPGAVDTDSSAIDARNQEIDAVADADEATDASPAHGQVAGTWGEGSATDAPSGETSGQQTGSAEGTFGGAGGGSPLGEESIDDQLATAEERVYEEPESAVWAEEDTKMGGGPAEHPERYDMAGAYVGVEPPEGFTIKGNERSMKYHVPASNSYERTIAQIWFASEEAAQEAGFTRAEH